MSGPGHGFLQHPSAPVPGYLLTRPLGRGPQAEVWKAFQERTGKWVAVKVFTDPAAFDWEALRANIERLVRLDRHPNVVSLLDADLSGAAPFFAMDLLEEDSLARRLASGEPVPPREAVAWLEDAARALSYVHGKGLIHGGLKPSNVLIDEQGRARISDLGQARRAAPGEEARADVGADIRSLAEAFAPAAEPDADEDLAAILSKCRADAPEDGYGSVSGLLADLEARRGRLPVSPLAAHRTYR
ncbi:MAG: protein kinase, partial [Elusimicrobia bacterium]|nr:protein kinase [Elusimicrobiota bacterium]